MTLDQLIAEVRKIGDHRERLEWLGLRQNHIRALAPDDDKKFQQVWAAMRDAEAAVDAAISVVEADASCSSRDSSPAASIHSRHSSFDPALSYLAMITLVAMAFGRIHAPTENGESTDPSPKL